MTWPGAPCIGCPSELASPSSNSSGWKMRVDWSTRCKVAHRCWNRLDHIGENGQSCFMSVKRSVRACLQRLDHNFIALIIRTRYGCEQGTAAVTAQRWLRKRKKCFTQRGCYRSWNFGTQRGEFDGTAASKVVEEKLRKHSSACDRPWIEPLGGMHLS